MLQFPHLIWNRYYVLNNLLQKLFVARSKSAFGGKSLVWYAPPVTFLVVMDYHVHPDSMLLTRESSNQIGFMTYADYMIFEGASIVPRAAQFPQQPKFL